VLSNKISFFGSAKLLATAVDTSVDVSSTSAMSKSPAFVAGKSILEALGLANIQRHPAHSCSNCEDIVARDIVPACRCAVINGVLVFSTTRAGPDNSFAHFYTFLEAARAVDPPFNLLANMT
jgi:hypothetical protein